jgi:hypothetical protein
MRAVGAWQPAGNAGIGCGFAIEELNEKGRRY